MFIFLGSVNPFASEDVGIVWWINWEISSSSFQSRDFFFHSFFPLRPIWTSFRFGNREWVEGFDFGWEEEEINSATCSTRDDGAMTGTNVWPAGLPEFRGSVLGY